MLDVELCASPRKVDKIEMKKFNWKRLAKQYERTNEHATYNHDNFRANRGGRRRQAGVVQGAGRGDVREHGEL